MVCAEMITWPKSARVGALRLRRSQTVSEARSSASIRAPRLAWLHRGAGRGRYEPRRQPANGLFRHPSSISFLRLPIDLPRPRKGTGTAGIRVAAEMRAQEHDSLPQGRRTRSQDNEGIRRHSLDVWRQPSLNACFNLHIHYFKRTRGVQGQAVLDSRKPAADVRAFDFLIPEDRLVLTQCSRVARAPEFVSPTHLAPTSLEFFKKGP